MKKLIMLSISLGVAALVSVQAADAKANWEKSCAKCHGPDGKGDTKMGKKLGIKDYSDAKVQEKFKDDEAIKAIKEGVKEKGTDKTLMKAAEGLTDAEIKDLVAFVRKLKK
jgi:cytochrome c553